MAGVPLERVPQFKYLGLWLDENLTFDFHVNKVYNKVCQRLGAIRKVRNCLGQSLALTLYKSLVLPHYDYCDTIYMCADKETLHKLQLVQNVGCRAILLSGRRTHVSDMHSALGLLPLEERRDLHLSQLCHKNVYYDKPQSLSKFFKPARVVGGRRTRGTTHNNMQVANLKTDKGRHAFGYRGPNHWNHLSNPLKCIVKYKTFHQELLKRTSLELDNHPT